MKKNNLTISLMLALLSMAFTFQSCKDDKDADMPIPTPSTEQLLSFHLHTNVAGVQANYTNTVVDLTGRKFNISDCRYYISNIVLIKNDNSELPITGKVLLVNPAENEYPLAVVPVGSYKGFRFMMGLDSATNHSDPTTYGADNPLSIQTPGIHWDWNSGYIFFKMEGKVDTTAASTGTPVYDYFYHVGMDDYKRTIDFSTSAFTVNSGSDLEIGINFELQNVLNNVDMRTENATHTMDNMMLATKIADNWQGAFEIE